MEYFNWQIICNKFVMDFTIESSVIFNKKHTLLVAEKCNKTTKTNKKRQNEVKGKTNFFH